ncbi:TKL family protein kinase [Tritrichomonas foetus]|uniref:TKL family protein kinase n=1 Tax=Tritrichomonas foetus TaxID=1144522 RepID=A0A1J4K849_9EUKA|nr:TKL family protein kinase [Tritrichomonas foetus]|eukprot:OHT07673.1 TKL family protein kinase [Tritrichomonas foetus]
MINEEPPLLTDDCIHPYIINYSDITFEKVIGSGAAGEVSIGTISNLTFKVAIKKLHDMKIDKDDLLFRREVYCLSMLRHPFVLPLIGFTNSYPFCIITKYIPGGSLFHVLRRKPFNLTGTDLTLIAYGVALAMKYIHGKTLIHRDLKTQNILIDEKNFPVICDFGSTRVLDKVMTGQCGTPNYMAPEFIRSEPYDQSVDVYSYGMILWEMLTKEVPFVGKDPAQVIYLILSGKSIEIPEDAPEGLKRLILACLSSNPSSRPSFDTIVELFESSTPIFQDCDVYLFEQTVKSIIESSRRKMVTSRSSSFNGGNPPPLCIARSASPKKHVVFHDNKMSVPNLSNFLQLINSYKGAISTGTDQQIRRSVDFFNQYSDNPVLAQAEIWPALLSALINAKPSYMISIQEMAINLARSHEVLASIAQVPDIHRFIRPETFELFLYIIKFVPQTISMQTVKTISSYAIKGKHDENCDKPIILLCEILNALPNDQQITDCILNFFVSIVNSYSNRTGGHLILRTLLNNGLSTDEMLALYAKSEITNNVIAAYECAFSMQTMPGMTSLPQIMAHALCDDEKIRSCALEFILRFGKGASGKPLLTMIEVLIEVFIKYESETAVLLLCRVAENHERNIILLNSKIADMWMLISPLKAPKLLQVFVILFLDVRHHQLLLSMKSSAIFLSNVVKYGKTQEVLTVCWLLPQMELNSAYAQFLEDAEFNENITARLENEKKPKIIIMLTKVINYVSKFICSKSFNQDIAILLGYIDKSNDATLVDHCILSLSCISYHQDTIQAIIDENGFRILSKVNKNIENTKNIKLIMNNLKASGLLSF